MTAPDVSPATIRRWKNSTKMMIGMVMTTAAAAVVITIPIVIFVLFFQRRIVAGLTSGAVKG